MSQQQQDHGDEDAHQRLRSIAWPLVCQGAHSVIKICLRSWHFMSWRLLPIIRLALGGPAYFHKAFSCRTNVAWWACVMPSVNTT